MCSFDRNSVRSSALNIHVSTTWDPCVLMIWMASPAPRRTARPRRAGSVNRSGSVDTLLASGLRRETIRTELLYSRTQKDEYCVVFASAMPFASGCLPTSGAARRLARSGVFDGKNGPVRTFEPGARHDRYQQKAALIEVSDKRPPDTACCERRDNWRDAIEKDQSWTIAHLCRRTAVQGSDRETRGACNIY